MSRSSLEVAFAIPFMSKPLFRISSLFLVPAVFALWQFVTLPAAGATTSLGKNGGGFGIVTRVADAQLDASFVGKKERPSQDNDRVPTSDQDLLDDGSDDDPVTDDLTSDDGSTPPFSSDDRAALILPAARILRTILPASTFALQCLDEHSHERAPPTLE